MKHRMVTAVLVALVQVSQSFPALYHRGWWRLLREGDSCGKCDLALCSEPKDCPAGTVLDRCGCCPECGNVEGQICDLDQGNHFYGQCGDHLECRLDADEARFGEVPEPQCVCKSQESICGPEGKTYENICQFNKAYAGKRNISVKHKGPCESAPVISMPPQDAQNYTGNDVIFGCEVSAYPMPQLEWKKKGNKVFLPGDDTHVSVQEIKFWGDEQTMPAVQAACRKAEAFANAFWKTSPMDREHEQRLCSEMHGKFLDIAQEQPDPVDMGHNLNKKARGGPQKYGVTGWLQIQGLKKSDEGIYVCHTKNKYGATYASARLKVIDDPSPALAFTTGSRSASYSIEYEEYYDNSDEEDDEEYESGDYDNENNSE